MGFSVIITLCVVAALVAALYSGKIRTAYAFLLAIGVLVLFKILSPAEALSGFANEQLAIIIILLIISDIIRKSKVLSYLFNKAIGDTSGEIKFLTKLMLFVAPLSAFFNNTPLVAIFMPFVRNWAVEHKKYPSQYLIPLSYATILGGAVTLVGTSTHLIVNGLVTENNLPSLSIFDFTPVGLAMLVLGLIYILIFYKTLPKNPDVLEDFNKQNRNFFIEANIKENAFIIGKSIEEASLRNLKSLFLVEIIRKDKIISPVSPNEILEQEDVLIFTGNTQSFDDLLDANLGLTLPKAARDIITENANIVEVVVSYNSWMIGKKIKETDFRGKYDGAIIAVHRNGEKLSGKIGDIIIQPGDVLLVLAGKDFYKRTENNQAFYILSVQQNTPTTSVGKVLLVFGLVLTSIILSAVNLLPLFTGLLITLIVAISLQLVPFNEIRKGLDFNLIFIIALGLALGRAMENSGTAEFISQVIHTYFSNLPVISLLMILFLCTNLLASYITNSAAVAIMFPIALALSKTLGINYLPFVLIISFGAAANFITPIGYQTNLMVYGPGRYKFNDYLKFGLPLTIIYMLAASFILYAMYF
ncbi:MAG TPA: SLC13 family permease [Flavobacteriales bacterium]|nr:SLC13 family permease [Flavobacteriales bacterium]|tara:strand:+ start:109579 stop:111339 length:1761 start_codon:yes stop_codon:yes gene_type:complete